MPPKKVPLPPTSFKKNTPAPTFLEGRRGTLVSAFLSQANLLEAVAWSRWGRTRLGRRFWVLVLVLVMFVLFKNFFLEMSMFSRFLFAISG